MGYSRILSHYPYVVLGAVSVFAATCLVVIVTIGEKPDFEDPKLGFEPRGTEISNRVRCLEKLLDETQIDKGNTAGTYHLMKKKKQKKEKHSVVSYRKGNHSKLEIQSTPEDDEEDAYIVEFNEPFFCDVPRKEYGRIVFESANDEDLFTLSHIRSMCRLEKQAFRKQKEFKESCVHKTSSRTCCRSWSLGNYIALLSNKSSCSDLKEDDVTSVYRLLENCVDWYYKFMLTANCEESPENCKDVPSQCTQHNAVYHILHHLTNVNFLKKDPQTKKRQTKLKYTMTFFPLAAGSGTKELYKRVEKIEIKDKNVAMVAVNFGIKRDLFDHYLQADTMWFGLALLAIFLSMWLYTTSLFLTVTTVVCIFLALEISYFLYTMVFEIKFFPFMNLLTVVILIGVGADDVFIYCKVWQLAKLEKNAGTLDKIVSDTLKHAALSMLVTSLTTAAAFFANYVSHITALQCFALYAGTAIIVNFLLMITWIPAVIVIQEKWCSQMCVCYGQDISQHKRGPAYYLCKFPYKFYQLLCDWSRIFFEKLLPCIVIKLRYLWIFIFSVLGISGVIIVFYVPRLSLPTSNEFQMFSSEHPFEVYDFQIKDQFWFEKAAGVSIPTMPLTIVWGVKAKDTGAKLDPYSIGEIVYDKNFNLAAPASQEWLLKFCRNLRSTRMYQLTPGVQLNDCFLENFRRFMEQRCEVDGRSNAPCCEESMFPYEESVFNQCLQEWSSLLARSSMFYQSHLGPRYSKETGKLVALIVEYNSKEPFSLSYEQMQVFYNYMNDWVKDEMKHAPSTMKGGWFVSHLDFYDLQYTIAKGTPVAIGVSIAIATIVAFLTTLNVLISLYAMVSIAASIFVTVASLVLLGWELNILESVTITVAVGLSIDFTLHYGMAYRLSPDLDREMRVVCATARIGSPVAMAAFTTFLAGAVMMPSTVLAYRQLGTFLMLIMGISWVYATFFFQPLLRCFGPQGGFGQFHWPNFDCCIGNGREHVDKTVYTLSESTVSSSSTNHANSSETHELEPLTETEQEHVPHYRNPRKHTISSSSSLDGPSPKKDFCSIRGYRSSIDLHPQDEVFHGHDSDPESQIPHDETNVMSKLLVVTSGDQNNTTKTLKDANANERDSIDSHTGTLWIKQVEEKLL